jgi:hypothetical protein
VKQYRKQFLLFVGVGSLAFSLACGGGGNNGGGGFGGGGGGTGNFSKASLNGQYAYQLSGFDLQTGNPFREAGVFTADGNGHITSGTDDSASGGSPATGAITGTYSISSDGTGQMTITFPNTSKATFALTLSSSSKMYMIEADTTGIVVSGVAVKQDTSAFASVPSGTFAFRMHEITVGLGGVTTSNGEVGAFTVNNGSITGNIDNNRNLIVNPFTITGSLNFPDATTGRGTGTFTDGVNPTSFNYYVVDASHFLLFSTTNSSGVVGLGQAEKQTGTFSKASLSGAYVFGSVGDASNFVNDTNIAGQFTADGNGGIASGTLDQVEDGTPTSVASPATFTGTYTVASSGRADVTLNSTIGTIHHILWMVSPTRAFSLTDSSSEVEDGTVDAQTGTFSNATLNGIYAFNLTGLDGSGSSLVTNDFVGTLKWDGAGGVTSRTVLNVNGTATQPPSATGTYTTGSNGRVVASINGISNNLVFYMISPTDAYLIQNDANVQLHGAMSKQP